MSVPIRISTNANARRSPSTRRRQASRSSPNITTRLSPAPSSVDERPGFKAMMERLLSNGVRMIVVETANRFARDLWCRKSGYAMLKARGIESDRRRQAGRFPRRYTDRDAGPPDARRRGHIRKGHDRRKLKRRPRRKSATGIKVEGRKSHLESRPEVVTLVATAAQ